MMQFFDLIGVLYAIHAKDAAGFKKLAPKAKQISKTAAIRLLVKSRKDAIDQVFSIMADEMAETLGLYRFLP